MILRTTFLTTALLVMLSGASPVLAENTTRDDDYELETDRLSLYWAVHPSAEEIEWLTAEAEATYARVAEMLEDDPPGKVHIVFGGSAEKPDGEWEYPRVDPFGRILLFKYTPDYRTYVNSLAHEMVHAFRISRRHSADWFFEEGFAEFVALRVKPSLSGFPWFDYPVTVVAGQWLINGPAIPLTTIRERHRELNLKCSAQTYSLRSAFFDWLGRTYGDDRVIEAAGSKPAGALEDYERIFGKSLEALIDEWHATIRKEYGEIPDVDAVAKTYRTESPIQYQQLCKPGEDF